MTAIPPGAVKVTLSGATGDIRSVAAMLADVTLERREAGGRVYLTVLAPATWH